MAVVKRQMQLLLPEIQCFLDVDNLVEIGNLEGYIRASQSVLIFLSRGYFSPKVCHRCRHRHLLHYRHRLLQHHPYHLPFCSPLQTV